LNAARVLRALVELGDRREQDLATAVRFEDAWPRRSLFHRVPHWNIRGRGLGK
jgi:hypothetical protein